MSEVELVSVVTRDSRSGSRRPGSRNADPMEDLADGIAADIKSPGAIPRRNGEPVFNEPWESRVFGMAVALCQHGLYAWDEFREQLIAEISSADARHEDSTYYDRFLRVLRRLLIEKQICVDGEIDQRATAESLTADDDH